VRPVPGAGATGSVTITGVDRGSQPVLDGAATSTGQSVSGLGFIVTGVQSQSATDAELELTAGDILTNLTLDISSDASGQLEVFFIEQGTSFPKLLQPGGDPLEVDLQPITIEVTPAGSVNLTAKEETPDAAFRSLLGNVSDELITDASTASEVDATLQAAPLSPGQNLVVGDGPKAVSVGHLDGDGVNDLAVANSQSDDISLMFGLGNGAFSPEIRLQVGRGHDNIIIRIPKNCCARSAPVRLRSGRV